MSFLIAFVCSAVLAVALKPVIKRVPAVWYLLALLFAALYLAGLQGVLPAWAKNVAFSLMQKGTLATALFAVVMFIGVLPRTGWLRLRLAPIRAELSIIACILICGHVAAYALSFVPRLLDAKALGVPVIVGLAAAFVLVALGLVLGITSIKRVHARMEGRTWTRIQRFAYAFYALMYIHALAMLLPSALAGGAAALQSVIAYTVVFALYAVLRIWRAVADRRGRNGQTSEAASAAV